MPALDRQRRSVRYRVRVMRTFCSIAAGTDALVYLHVFIRGFGRSLVVGFVRSSFHPGITLRNDGTE